MIAALFVLKDGPYFDIPGVDTWAEERDARTYSGPWPVVAHPPCARWGSYWYGSPSSEKRFELGDDGGCFDAALGSVRRWGGVLEHPAGSKAWAHFGIPHPPNDGGWIPTDAYGLGWTCCVEQGNYGHHARKKTWLFAVRTSLPELKWGDSGKRRSDGKKANNGVLEMMSKRQRATTPVEFRDLLLSLAKSVS